MPSPKDTPNTPAPASHPRAKRNWLKYAVFTGMFLLASVGFYFHHFPAGVDFWPWYLARVEGPILKSPDGQRELRVFFNDAGAMHSGNHWTWIVEDCWWCGSRVVDEGYLDYDALRTKSVPITWEANNEFRVDFLQDRYSAR